MGALLSWRKRLKLSFKNLDSYLIDEVICSDGRKAHLYYYNELDEERKGDRLFTLERKNRYKDYVEIDWVINVKMKVSKSLTV